MPQALKENKKLTIVILILSVFLTFLIGITSVLTNNLDLRSNAAIDEKYIGIGAFLKGTEKYYIGDNRTQSYIRIRDFSNPIEVNFYMSSLVDYKISAIDFFFEYNTDFLKLDVLNKTVSDECRDQFYKFDSNTSVLLDRAGKVRFTNFAIRDLPELPSSKSCIGTVRFTPINRGTSADYTKAYIRLFDQARWSITSAEQEGLILSPLSSGSIRFIACLDFAFGDFDCNTKVNLVDFEIFRSEFMEYKLQKPAFAVKSDLDYNEYIDIGDFGEFREGFLKFNKPAVSSSTTPTVSPTPSKINSCIWCGTSCTPFKAGIACPAVMPPDGKLCKVVSNKCQIVDAP